MWRWQRQAKLLCINFYSLPRGRCDSTPIRLRNRLAVIIRLQRLLLMCECMFNGYSRGRNEGSWKPYLRMMILFNCSSSFSLRFHHLRSFSHRTEGRAPLIGSFRFDAIETQSTISLSLLCAPSSSEPGPTWFRIRLTLFASPPLNQKESQENETQTTLMTNPWNLIIPQNLFQCSASPMVWSGALLRERTFRSDEEI